MKLSARNQIPGTITTVIRRPTLQLVRTDCIRFETPQTIVAELVP